MNFRSKTGNEQSKAFKYEIEITEDEFAQVLKSVAKRKTESKKSAKRKDAEHPSRSRRPRFQKIKN